MLPFENLFIQGPTNLIQTQILLLLELLLELLLQLLLELLLLLLLYDLRRNSRGALRAPVEVRGKVHTAEAAAAPAAAGSVSEENLFDPE